jgi:hypothetical protein
MPNDKQILNNPKKIYHLLENIDTKGMPFGYRDNLLGVFSIYNPALFPGFGQLAPYTTLPAGTAVKLPSAPSHESSSTLKSGRPDCVFHVFTREELEKILPGIWSYLKDWGSGTILNPGVWQDWLNFKTALGIFEESSPSKAYYFKTIQGQACVVFKGYPGLRTGLKKPFYKLSDPKIVQLGIGVRGIYGSVKSGCFWAICIYSALLTVEAVVRAFGNNPMSVGAYTANISIGAVKAALAGAAVVLTTAVIEKLAVGFITAGSGLIICFAVGIGTGMVLNYFDAKYGITKALEARIDAEWERTKVALNKVQRYTSDAFLTRQIIWRLTNGRCSSVQCLAGLSR